jgi:signal transduction histidine kinase
VIQYSDDGIGFNIEETISQHKGLGLFNLQNRIQTVGGKITLTSKKNEGVYYQFIVNND